MSFFKKYIPVIGLTVLGIIVGVGATLLIQYVRGPKQMANVTGQGTIEVPADQASIMVSVDNSSWSQAQADKDNKDETQALKDALLKLGIPESRITESNYGYGIQPVMENQSGSAPMMAPVAPPTSTSSANNNYSSTSLTIVLDSLNNIDTVFKTINTSPHAKITNVDYSLKSTAPYEAQVREKALQDTRNQAESIAKINNLRVGKLVSINSAGSPTDNTVNVQGNMMVPSTNGSTVYGEKTISLSASFYAQYELY